MVERVFTGLITELGVVRSYEKNDNGAKISIEAPKTVSQLCEGDSVAIDGVCLTAVAVEDKSFTVEVMNQTITSSKVGAAKNGDGVNLELPLKVSDRLGGHFVQGHVDGVGEVVSVVSDGFASRLQISVSHEIRCYLAGKGSVAVNGVSLTISGLDDKSFEVSLIPETLTRTNLGRLNPNDRVNVEVDMLSKYVAEFLSANR